MNEFVDGTKKSGTLHLDDLEALVSVPNRWFSSFIAPYGSRPLFTIEPPAPPARCRSRPLERAPSCNLVNSRLRHPTPEIWLAPILQERISLRQDDPPRIVVRARFPLNRTRWLPEARFPGENRVRVIDDAVEAMGFREVWSDDFFVVLERDWAGEKTNDIE